jgi:hypothetical protein
MAQNEVNSKPSAKFGIIIGQRQLAIMYNSIRHQLLHLEKVL